MKLFNMARSGQSMKLGSGEDVAEICGQILQLAQYI